MGLWSNTCIAGISSHSVASLFISLMKSFKEQKSFILMQSNLSFFSLMVDTFYILESFASLKAEKIFLLYIILEILSF